LSQAGWLLLLAGRLESTGHIRARLIRSPTVRRISVVGTPGAGKSTVARELARNLGVPFVELDGIFHQPDWAPLAADEFRRRVAEVTAGDAWVIDGNYSDVRPLVWARADTVLWIDLPRMVVMRRLIWRTLRRAAFRVELWNGNRERWANFFTWDPERSVISWAWHRHAVYRQRYGSAMQDPACAHLRFVRLRSRPAVRRFLAGTSPGSAGIPLDT
jgi:adenylate kinase family enzyme